MADNPTVQSIQNSMVKYAHSLKVPKRLRESEDFWCEGFHLLKEALEGGLRVRFLFFTPEAEGRPEGKEILEKAGRAKVRCVRVAPKIIFYLSDTQAPQGMAAVVRKPASPLDFAASSMLLGVYGVQDPGNLGTLFRSAEAFGAQGLLLAGGCCDPFNPKAVRASMGSILRVPFSEPEDWKTCFQNLKSSGFQTAALTAHSARNLPDAPLSGRTVFWVGAEGAGLPGELVSACDERVRIPMLGKVESLNAGVAGSLALFFGAFKAGWLNPSKGRGQGSAGGGSGD